MLGMAEPTTALTDFMMAAVALILAIRIGGYWRYAFLFTSIAAVTGGIYHASQSALMWKLTVYAVGIGTFFLIAAASRISGPRRLVMAFAAIEFLAYAFWMAAHDDFVYVIADYGSGMLCAGILYAVAYRRMPRAAGLVLSSIAVAAVGAAVQASRFTLHRNFNHNDLYHVIQIVSLVLLYRGARASDIIASTAPASE
jgi:hypothetical protein